MIPRIGSSRELMVIRAEVVYSPLTKGEAPQVQGVVRTPSPLPHRVTPLAAAMFSPLPSAGRSQSWREHHCPGSTQRHRDSRTSNSIGMCHLRCGLEPWSDQTGAAQYHPGSGRIPL